MEAGVKKSEEAEHAAKANQFGELEEFAQRRDAKSEDEEAKRPITRGVLDELDGIRTKISSKCAPNENAKRRQTEKKNRNLGPFVDEERGHASNQPQ
jgi:hypothetical protein